MSNFREMINRSVPNINSLITFHKECYSRQQLQKKMHIDKSTVIVIIRKHQRTGSVQCRPCLHASKQGRASVLAFLVLGQQISE